MTTTRRRVAAIAGLVAAGLAAVTVYVRSSSYPDGSGPAQQQQGRETPSSAQLGQIAVVVSTLDNYQSLLDSHPSLVLVGTGSTKLRKAVKQTDQHRVIETQTPTGWQHIVKHLRPDTVILSQGLSGDPIKGFTQRVLLMDEASEML